MSKRNVLPDGMQQKPDVFWRPGSREADLAVSDQHIFDTYGVCAFIREFHRAELARIDLAFENLEYALVILYGTQQHIDFHVSPLAGEGQIPSQIISPRYHPAMPYHARIYLTDRQRQLIEQEQKKDVPYACPGLLSEDSNFLKKTFKL